MQYTFWIHGWNESPLYWVWRDLSKCIVNSEKIVIYHGKDVEKELLIKSIKKCDIGSQFRTSIHYIELDSEDEGNIQKIYIFPSNPFAPWLLLHQNISEAKYLQEVITAFSCGQIADVLPNPYFRQLKYLDTPKRFTAIQEQWDENISPLEYFRKYRDKYQPLRLVILIVLLPLVVVFVLAFVLDMIGVI